MFSVRQAVEGNNQTILSGGSFVTAYPPAYPAPSFLFFPFCLQRHLGKYVLSTLNIKCAPQLHGSCHFSRRIYFEQDLFKSSSLNILNEYIATHFPTLFHRKYSEGYNREYADMTDTSKE